MEPDSPDRVRRLEAQIRQLEAELAQTHARIAGLEQGWEQWLNLISHDFRGPLTLILGYTQTLLQHLPDDGSRDQERHDLQAAVNAAQRLDKMVGDTVDAARLEARLLTLAPTEVDLALIVREQIRRANRRYPGRSIHSSISTSLPRAFADARRAGHIVATLLSNAVLFSPETSPVTVTVRQAGQQIVVYVADGGVGLTESEKARVFEKFYRPERARHARREGLGLSLLVAEQLTRRQGGRLWVESPGADQGSTFFLTLPVMTSGE